MDIELIKAHLSLYAVLVNLEDLVALDRESSSLAKDWDISIQFTVKGGPSAHVIFKNGACTVGRGRHKHSSVILYFTSPAHLNRMFEGKGNPIPLRGFTKLGFLGKDFPKLTKRLEHYLKPTPELLRDPSYMALNTRFTLNTAAFAACELGRLDPVGKLNMSHIHNGALLFKVLPKGPAVSIDFSDGDGRPGKGDVARPMSALFFKNIKVANDMLSGRLDMFAAVAKGELMLRGHISMIDSLGAVLDRIPLYLS